MKTLVLALVIAVMGSIVANAAEITIKITINAPDEGTATVKLNTSKNTWSGTNDSGDKVLGSLNGEYVVAEANTFPGYGMRGTALVRKGGSAKKGDDIDTVLGDFIPSENTKSGEAKAFKTVGVGTWQRQ